MHSPRNRCRRVQSVRASSSSQISDKKSVNRNALVALGSAHTANVRRKKQPEWKSPYRKVRTVMAKRRGHGEGSISQRADGRWMARVDLGWENGRRRYKALYGRTRRDVAGKLTKVLRDVQRQTVG